MSRDVDSCTHWLRPRTPPPPHWDSYTRVRKERRHFFVTPWALPKAGRERCVRGGEGSSSSRGIALQLEERFNVVILILQVALPKITVSSVSDPGPRWFDSVRSIPRSSLKLINFIKLMTYFLKILFLPTLLDINFCTWVPTYKGTLCLNLLFYITCHLHWIKILEGTCTYRSTTMVK